MSTLKIDPATGDIAMVNNSPVTIEGADEVAQIVRSNLKTFLGEWFLDTTIGMPFHQYIFLKGADPQKVALFIKKAILGSKGVLALNEYSQEYDGATRKFSVKFSIKASDEKILTFNEVIG